jgi:hypothetical protein
MNVSGFISLLTENCCMFPEIHRFKYLFSSTEEEVGDLSVFCLGRKEHEPSAMASNDRLFCTTNCLIFSNLLLLK